MYQPRTTVMLSLYSLYVSSVQLCGTFISYLSHNCLQMDGILHVTPNAPVNIRKNTCFLRSNTDMLKIGS